MHKNNNCMNIYDDSYLEERTRKEKALEWDRKEEYMMI